MRISITKAALSIAIVACAAIAGGGVATALSLTATSTLPGARVISASATLVDARGAQIGHATLAQAREGVVMHVRVSGLTAGKKALHIQSDGACHAATEPDPTSGTPQPRLLPHIFVGADGVGEMEAYAAHLQLDGDMVSWLGEDGASLVIADAGAPLACGTIIAG